MVLLEEALVQDQLLRAVDQLQGAELRIAIKYGCDEAREIIYLDAHNRD